MLQTIKKIFGQQGTDHQNPSQITDKGRIVSLLERVRESRLNLQVNLPGDNERYASALLRVDPGKGLICLDELNPVKGHERARFAEGITVHTLLEGVDLTFSTQVLEVGHRDGIAYYRASLPHLLHYNQRRSFYRLKLDRRHPVILGIHYNKRRETIRGRLSDISLGGLAARIEKDLELQAGESLGSCSLHLPGADVINCSLDVRHVQAETRGGLRIGAEFSAINSEAQDLIFRFVRSLERDQLRRHLM
ncbi:MAG: flagellar brake protein [Chromatiales bacterium]|nr:flagellar brake protein [Chromatiales bacterium]